MSNEAHPTPRWGTHFLILGLVALAEIGFLALRKPSSSAASGLGPGVDIAVGLSAGLQELGLILLTLTVALSYAVASTLMLFALRRRRGAIGWAHGTSALFVVAFLALFSGDNARKKAEEDLRHQRMLEAQALAERQEREAAARAQRDCLHAKVRFERLAPIGRTSRASTYPIELELDLRCERNYVVSVARLEAIRLRAEGAGWKLEPFEQRYEPALQVAWEDIAVGGFVSGATDEVFEQGRFTLEVQFARDGGSEEWTPQPIEGVHVTTRWMP
ncbi:MAG: hypothetical protein Q8N23_29715 [Archangium sp.]|nr:hypothetical protein [Archangium sp.]MDP3575562.1 hypothetical protein [Archangium sp.]